MKIEIIFYIFSFLIISEQKTIKTHIKIKNFQISNLDSDKIKTDLLDAFKKNETEKKNSTSNLKFIFNKIFRVDCQDDYICIDIGRICGNWDLDLKNHTEKYTVPVEHDLVIKPTLIYNNTKINVPYKVNETAVVIDDDCDSLGNLIIIRSMKFKQTDLIDKNNPPTAKFYRKISYGKNLLTKDFFKQGINLIIIDEMNKLIFEKTYSSKEFDDLACKIAVQRQTCIIILTGIGDDWLYSLTPKLVKEIRIIGGPDFSKIQFIKAEMAFFLVGKRGLCENNGEYKILSSDKIDLIKFLLYPTMTDNCSQMFIKIEKCKEACGFWIEEDITFRIAIKNDNRFSSNFPTVIITAPYNLRVQEKSLQILQIKYFTLLQNYKVNKIVLKEQKYKLYCNDFSFYNKFTVECTIDFRLYEIPLEYTLKGNIVIELLDLTTGYRMRSSAFTCPHFNILYTKPPIINKLFVVKKEDPKILVIKETFCCKRNMPCCPLVKPIMIYSDKRMKPTVNYLDKKILVDNS